MSEWYSLSTQETLTCIFLGQQNCRLHVHNHLFQIGRRLSTVPVSLLRLISSVIECMSILPSTVCTCTDLSQQGSEIKTTDRSLFLSIIYIKNKKKSLCKIDSFHCTICFLKKTKLENYTFMFPSFKNLLFAPSNAGC